MTQNPYQHLAPISEALKASFEQIDWDCLSAQESLLKQNKSVEPLDLLPFIPAEPESREELIKIGQDLLRKRKAACLIVAGGQGTRLGFHGPKGLFPISVVRHKPLFQLLAEKVKAASEFYGCSLPIAIMTSPENDQETKEYFRSNNNFSLNDDQLFFFTQKCLPLLDENGKLFLQSKDELSMGPNGNGSSIKRLVEEGIFQKWKEQGIESLFFIPVDNPLADPFDPLFLGFAKKLDLEIGVKCVEKTNPEEKVGVLVRMKTTGSLQVVEYSELDQELRGKRDTAGNLCFGAANLSLLLFSFPFIEKNWQADLPLHLAHKAMPIFDSVSNKSVTPTEPNAWKFETFIFDYFPYAKKIDALLFARNEVFAPLKNKEGSDSPVTVQALLMAKDRNRLKELSLSFDETEPLELSARAHYFAPKTLPSSQKLHGYID